MALSAGTCSIASDGTVTGTGLAKTIADAHKAAFSAFSPAQAPKAIARLMTSGFYETFSNALAAAIINHLTSNGEITVTIHPTDIGLQTSAAAGSPTTGPAANKTLTGTIA